MEHKSEYSEIKTFNGLVKWEEEPRPGRCLQLLQRTESRKPIWENRHKEEQGFHRGGVTSGRERERAVDVTSDQDASGRHDPRAHTHQRDGKDVGRRDRPALGAQPGARAAHATRTRSGVTWGR